MDILHVYFDMDGVLAEFTEEPEPKPFMSAGSHYFRNLPADTKAVDLMRCLDEFPKVKVHVLTRLVPRISKELADEHETDKLLWCRDMRLMADPLDFICIRDSRDKNQVLDRLPSGERRSRHVLIDDDPRILRDWRRAGGEIFQYIQRKRDVVRLDCTQLTQAMPVPDMVAAILLMA